MPGYHLKEIKKGVIGQASKIYEEFLEFSDALAQSASVMAILELTDLVGAVELFCKEHQLDFSLICKNSILEYHSFDKAVVPESTIKTALSIESQVSALMTACSNMDNMTSPDFDKEATSLILERLLCNVQRWSQTFNLTLEDLLNMSAITQRAFTSGARS